MTLSEVATMPASVPSRHRENEARGARLGRPLRLAARLFRPLEQAKLDRIGAGLLEQDQGGAAVAEAIRTRVISHADLRRALAGDVSDDTPLVLRTFIAAAEQTPAWVDWDRIDRGGQVFRRFGIGAGSVLLGLSLVGGFRFGGPAELLVETGGLSGNETLRRVAETQYWTLRVTDPGSLRPGAEGWRLTLHVRVMHALVNATYAADWDVKRWGLPINQADQAGTLGLFDGALLMGIRALGARVSRQDAADLMHLWKYVGWLLGVHDDFLTDVERERQWWNLHILTAAPSQTDAGRALAQSILQAENQKAFPGRTRLARALQRRYNRERILSLWTFLLGPRSMVEIGLPMRPPWAAALAFTSNAFKHRVIAFLPDGRDWLEARGRREQERIQAQYRHGLVGAVAELPEQRTYSSAS